MKIRKVFLTVIILFEFLSTVNAQSHLIEGYVITKQNDTTYGFIDVLKSNWKICVFKEDKNKKEIKFMPGDIKAYRFAADGKFFISKKIPFQEIDKDVFLEFLVKGKLNLYFYRDDMDHYFIEKDTTKLIELSERPVLLKDSIGNLYYKRPKFKGVLNYVLSDCPDMLPHINNIELQPEPLVNLVKEYQKKVCNSEQCVVFERKMNNIKIHSYIELGLNYSQVFGTYNYSKTNFTPCFQLGYKIKIDHAIFSAEQISFQAGLILGFNNDFTRFRDGSNINWIPKSTYDFNSKSIKLNLPLSVIYSFGSSKINPYLGVGVMSQLVLSRENASNTSVYPFPFPQFGLLGLAGLKFELPNQHTINLEFSYNYSSDFKGIGFLSTTRNQNISGTIAYEL